MLLGLARIISYTRVLLKSYKGGHYYSLALLYQSAKVLIKWVQKVISVNYWIINTLAFKDISVNEWMQKERC